MLGYIRMNWAIWDETPFNRFQWYEKANIKRSPRIIRIKPSQCLGPRIPIRCRKWEGFQELHDHWETGWIMLDLDKWLVDVGGSIDGGDPKNWLVFFMEDPVQIHDLGVPPF